MHGASANRRADVPTQSRRHDEHDAHWYCAPWQRSRWRCLRWPVAAPSPTRRPSKAAPAQSRWSSRSATPIRANGTSRSTTRKIIQTDLGAANVDIEIVAYGPGIGMLKLDSTVGGRVDEATAAGVKVVACEITMKGQKLTRADMLNGIGYVPAGVVELMSRQQQGWAYIRPVAVRHGRRRDPGAPRSQNSPVMICKPSRATLTSMCSFGCVLRARRIGVRHPDRRQAQDLGKAIVRQRPAEIRQNRRRRASGRGDRCACPAHPRDDRDRGALLPSAPSSPAPPYHAKSTRIEVGADRGNERAPFASGDKTQLKIRDRARRYRVDRPLRIAGTKREYFERVPAEHALCRASATAPPSLHR